MMTDADLSTPIDDLEILEPHLAQASVVLGSRAVATSRITHRQPRYRELMGKTFNKFLWLMGVWGFYDTQCGFKLLDGEVARTLFRRMVTEGFAFDVELVWLARRLGFAVAEVGVHWHHVPESRVDALRHPPRMIAEVLRFRWLHRGLPRVRGGTP